MDISPMLLVLLPAVELNRLSWSNASTPVVDLWQKGTCSKCWACHVLGAPPSLLLPPTAWPNLPVWALLWVGKAPCGTWQPSWSLLRLPPHWELEEPQKASQQLQIIRCGSMSLSKYPEERGKVLKGDISGDGMLQTSPQGHPEGRSATGLLRPVEGLIQ